MLMVSKILRDIELLDNFFKQMISKYIEICHKQSVLFYGHPLKKLAPVLLELKNDCGLSQN